MTTLIVLTIISIVLMVAAVTLLVKRINENNALLQSYYNSLYEDIQYEIKHLLNMENLLGYAVSRLPKTRSKKVNSETDETEDIIKNIEPVED